MAFGFARFAIPHRGNGQVEAGVGRKRAEQAEAHAGGLGQIVVTGFEGGFYFVHPHFFAGEVQFAKARAFLHLPGQGRNRARPLASRAPVETASGNIQGLRMVAQCFH